MPRKPRIQFAGAIYHVYSRGNNRSDLFLDDADYRAYLRLVRAVIARLGWRVLAYCLMPNHFHLILQTPEPDLALGMQQIKGKYARRFNDRHGHSGARYDGRYGDVLIQDDQHFLVALRYLALNPVEAALTRTPWGWRWSSCAELHTAADRPVANFPALFALLDDPPRAHARYVRLIGGDEEFDIELDPRTMLPRPKRPALAEFDLLDLAQLTSAHHDHGYTQVELAEALGCHQTTIGRRIKSRDPHDGPDLHAGAKTA